MQGGSRAELGPETDTFIYHLAQKFTTTVAVDLDLITPRTPIPNLVPWA